MNSRAKGKRGELEARDVVRKYWHSPECVRAAQVSGKFSADLLGGPPGLHIEVKRRKRLAVTEFWDQAWGDAAEYDQVPVVIMREDNHPAWLVMFDLRNTEEFVEAYLAAKGSKEG